MRSLPCQRLLLVHDISSPVPALASYFRLAPENMLSTSQALALPPLPEDVAGVGVRALVEQCLKSKPSERPTFK